MNNHRVGPRAAIAAKILALTCLAPACAPQVEEPVPDSSEAELHGSESGPFLLEVVSDAIGVPFGIAFLDSGSALVTDRADGGVLRVDLASGASVRLGGVPEVFTQLDGGILDVALSPDFANDGWVYYSYSRGDVDGSQTVVARARLSGEAFVDHHELLASVPPRPGANHYGSRLEFCNGYLFIAQGDRLHRADAQDLASHNGKILRLNPDGTVPPDNPFVGVAGALTETWSYGHRNPQGLECVPEAGELWVSEHGPMGGDEVNRIEAGANYGWPLVSFGNEYDGGPIGTGHHFAPDTESPVWIWTPSIAPSGMHYYDGSAFPAWRGSFFVGALAGRHLNRLRIRDHRVLTEERLLVDFGQRIRFAVGGPDGLVYVGADGAGLVRLRPSS